MFKLFLLFVPKFTVFPPSVVEHSSCSPLSSFQISFAIHIYAPEQDTREKIAAALVIELPYFCLLL